MSENEQTHPTTEEIKRSTTESIDPKIRSLAETSEEVLKLFTPFEQAFIRALKEYLKQTDEKTAERERKLIKS